MDCKGALEATKGDLETRRFILEHYSDPRICTVEDIVFFNGLGGFSPDGSEYAIYMKPGDCTPAPWASVS